MSQRTRVSTPADRGPHAAPSSHAGLDRFLRALGYVLRNHLLRQPRLRAHPVALDSPLWVARDDGIGRRLYKRGEHEPEVTALLARAAATIPQDVILDIGAHCGFFARLLLQSAPHASIHAFEADPSNYALLYRNLARDLDRAIAVHAAVADAEGTLLLHRYKSINQGKHSLIPFDEPAEGGVVEVPATTLDVYWRESSLDGRTPTLWKMDVEGAEHRVLLGGRDLAARCPLIVSEFSPRFLRRAELDPAVHVALFEELGFVPFRIAPGGRLEQLETGRLCRAADERVEIAWAHRRLALEQPFWPALRG
ncbi:MAG: FkbM family methyltransferase [Planctomycetes bacterium]|nr:FkbM family methyltransferase [Planctomycetota bacterium]